MTRANVHARLDSLVSAARDAAPAWDAERASSVLAGALHKKASRARRERLVRRGLVVASGVAVVALMFIRSASSSTAHEGAHETASAPIGETFAVHALDDAGYARD